MNKFKDKLNKEQIYIWVILLIAFILRLVCLQDIPAGVNQDEAMGAVDAWALSQYGTDRFGTVLPVHFAAWGESHMSVMLAYSMVPFIWLFGFSTFVIRIPMVLYSVLGIGLMYLVSTKFFSKKLSLAIMVFCAINPWHFMQSRWSLDCNLFPHVFLLAFYLLLLGLEKKKYLYLSMVVFGLTFYCYGIAVYTVPVFLFVYAAWCLWKKQLALKEVLISIGIFFVVALPEILTMFINMFDMPTMCILGFTIPYFPDSARSNDILFLNFSFAQLGKNALCLLKQVFLQCPDHIFNALPKFGTMYHISTPFMLLGIGAFVKRFFINKDMRTKTIDLALIGFLLMGIWAGIITYEVNVNRINIIFYPLMLFTLYGIWTFIAWLPRYALYLKNGFVIAYSILAIAFFVQYFGAFPSQIKTMFNEDFLTIVREADELEAYDKLYVSANMDWQTNPKMAEILTQYSCKIDARYVQGNTNETGGRELLPYSERYHFVNIGQEEAFDEDAIYVISEEDLEYINQKFDEILNYGVFYAVNFQ